MTTQDTTATQANELTDLHAHLATVRTTILSCLEANDYRSASTLTADTYGWLIDMESKHDESAYGELAAHLSEWWRVNTNPCS